MTENNAENTAVEGAEGAVDQKPAKPFLSVVKGNPTDAEVATLTVLFAGMAAGAADEGPKGPQNQWGRLEDRLQQPLSFSPGSFLNVQYY